MIASVLIAGLSLYAHRTPPVVEPQASSSNDCEFEDRRAREKFLENPPAGVELGPGIVTGMSRAEVRQVSRRLLAPGHHSSYELFPGFRADASVSISDKTKIVNGLWLTGRDGSQALKALMAHFGEPTKREATGHFIENVVHITGGNRFVKGESIRWCKANIVIYLTTGEDKFSVWIGPK